MQHPVAKDMAPDVPTVRDPLVHRVSEASLRLMAGLVPRQTVQALQQRVRENEQTYPWEEVVDKVLNEPVDDQRLVQQGLRAQRDWLLRAGTRAPGTSVSMRGKVALAFFLSRLLFFGLFTVALVVLLMLIKARWPAIDIYRPLEWLRDVLPGVFGRN